MTTRKCVFKRQFSPFGEWLYNTYLRYLNGGFFVVPWWSEWAWNDIINLEFITLLNSVMNSGLIMSFRARSDYHGMTKNPSLRYLTYLSNWLNTIHTASFLTHLQYASVPTSTYQAKSELLRADPLKISFKSLFWKSKRVTNHLHH